MDYTVYTLYRTSSTSYTLKSGDCYFRADWRDKNDSTVTWGNPTTFEYEGHSGMTVSGGGSGNTYVTNLVYLRHVWGIWGGNRMLRITPGGVSLSDDARICGMGKSTDNSYHRTPEFHENGYRYYYIYNYDNITQDVNTAKAGCNYHVTGTWYIYTRALYSLTYNANGGSGGTTSGSILAGVGYNLTTNFPTRTGYTFKGWGTVASGGTIYPAGYSFGDSYASTNRTYYAIWEPQTYRVSFSYSGSLSTSTETRELELTEMSNYNWVRYKNSDNISASRSASRTSLYIYADGGWEIIGIPIYFATTNIQYNLTFNYQVPSSYTPLSGYSGLRVQLLTSSPDDSDNLSKERTGVYLPTSTSSGTQTLTFTPNQNILYLCVNGGYVADGVDYTFYFSDFKLTTTTTPYKLIGAIWRRLWHLANIKQNRLFICRLV